MKSYLEDCSSDGLDKFGSLALNCGFLAATLPPAPAGNLSRLHLRHRPKTPDLDLTESLPESGHLQSPGEGPGWFE